MKKDFHLSTGRIVSHRPYLTAGVTEAYIVGGGEMTDAEWSEYARLTAPVPKPKLTWKDIKALKTV